MDANRMGPPIRPQGQWPGGGGQQRKGCLASVGCLLALSIVFNVVLVIVIGAVSDTPQPGSSMKEVWVSGKGKYKIALIRLEGTIGEGQSSYGKLASASSVVAQLERARRDPLVKGILMMVNSPGGTVTASDQIHHSVVRLKKSGKPVVALMGDTCASGCVYATAAAAKIFAHPTTVTGSIGVIISTLNFSKLLENYGVQGVVIASKENKALLSPFHPVKEEHKEILKKIVDELFGRFASILVRWRKIPKDKLSVFADGRVFSASRAKAHGLIDGIGYGLDAKRALMKLTALKEARLIRYHRPMGLTAFLTGYAQLPALIKESTKRPTLENVFQQSAPKAYYLWTPSTRR